MPWSAKAQELLRHQYAAVGAASRAALPQAVTALEQALARGMDVATLLDDSRKRIGMVEQYVESYRRYCWPVQSLGDLKIAPFHLLAAEGRAFTDQDHIWHMNILAKLCAASDLLLSTPFLTADLANDESEAHVTRWWEELTGNGGEGMVVKPIDFVAKGRRGVTQPAVKCRGREYLRIIYGPEYTAPANLDRLRSRGVSTKRSLECLVIFKMSFLFTEPDCWSLLTTNQTAGRGRVRRCSPPRMRSGLHSADGRWIPSLQKRLRLRRLGLPNYSFPS